MCRESSDRGVKFFGVIEWRLDEKKAIFGA
jgi:hypothetical protein